MTGLYFDSIKTASSVLKRYKLRSFLTIVSVIIGVVTIMLVSSIMSVIRLSIEEEIELIGTNSIYVNSHIKPVEKLKISQRLRMRKPLTIADTEAINKLPSIAMAVPIVNVTVDNEGKQIHVKGPKSKRSSQVTVLGANATVSRAKDKVLTEGRWFTKIENDQRKDVAIINSVLAEDFFPNTARIGKKIQIDRRIFLVIGVLEQRGQMFGGRHNPREIYLPLKPALRMNPNADGLYILAVAKSKQMLNALEEIEDVLRARRRLTKNMPSDFSINIATERIEKFRSMMSNLYILTIFVASITLLIGGIGVTNIMLVSVTARTREIGLRKAVGAKRSHILIQFLFEATVMTSIGGIFGVVLGGILGVFLATILPSQLSLWSIILGLCLSGGVGIISGFFPAWKASRQNPIDALRFE